MISHEFPVNEYFFPGSSKEASEILSRGKGEFLLLGGATSFTFSRPGKVKALVDLSRTGLDYVKIRKKSIGIGALTPIRELAHLPIFQRYAGGVVHEAAVDIATTPLRNMITVGGNVMKIFLWSDLPPLFLALNARFLVCGPGGGKKTFGADEFFSSQPRSLIGKNAILKEVSLPRNPETFGAFIKYSLTETDFALINACAVLRVSDGECRQLRLTVGAVTPLPRRLLKAEKFLTGKKLNRKNIREAAALGAGELSPLKDIRTEPGYREKILPVILERCLITAWERAQNS